MIAEPDLVEDDVGAVLDDHGGGSRVLPLVRSGQGDLPELNAGESAGDDERGVGVPLDQPAGAAEAGIGVAEGQGVGQGMVTFRDEHDPDQGLVEGGLEIERRGRRRGGGEGGWRGEAQEEGRSTPVGSALRAGGAWGECTQGPAI